jgi:hypothetical protein
MVRQKRESEAQNLGFSSRPFVRAIGNVARQQLTPAENAMVVDTATAVLPLGH